MNETTRNSFRLGFLTDRNTAKIINVPRANTALNNAAVKDIMLSIIDSDAVMSPSGIPTQKSSAALVTTVTRDVTLFES